MKDDKDVIKNNCNCNFFEDYHKIVVKNKIYVLFFFRFKNIIYYEFLKI